MLIRQNRRLVMRRADMSRTKIERIAENRMDVEQADLDALMGD
jgi:hypothetical protein